MIKRFKNYRETRRLTKREAVLAERLEEVNALIERRREGTPDKYRRDKDYLKPSESVIYGDLIVEHYEVCNKLGKKSKYFDIRGNGGYLMGDDSPSAYISVNERRATTGDAVVYNDDVEDVEIIIDGIIEK